MARGGWWVKDSRTGGGGPVPGWLNGMAENQTNTAWAWSHPEVLSIYFKTKRARKHARFKKKRMFKAKGNIGQDDGWFRRRRKDPPRWVHDRGKKRKIRSAGQERREDAVATMGVGIQQKKKDGGRPRAKKKKNSSGNWKRHPRPKARAPMTKPAGGESQLPI